MKNLIAYPSLLREIGDKLYQQLGDFDIICGVPYGGLPIATYISTTYNKPIGNGIITAYNMKQALQRCKNTTSKKPD